MPRLHPRIQPAKRRVDRIPAWGGLVVFHVMGHAGIMPDLLPGQKVRRAAIHAAKPAR
ncbi:hypothetical protein Nm8I071_37050 [Nonomuraea sp. TT08I-71]|nr:hypothetical protein Nm8I071_37050 [Nonomuraea sp. TT08I-71]